MNKPKMTTQEPATFIEAVCGQFNVDPKHPAWRELRAFAEEKSVHVTYAGWAADEALDSNAFSPAAFIRWLLKKEDERGVNLSVKPVRLSRLIRSGVFR